MKDKPLLTYFNADEVLTSVKRLNDILRIQFALEPIFFDIVSVELKQGKDYRVFWYGPSKSFLDNYKKYIKQYFDERNISFLFLKIANNTDSIFIPFDNFVPDSEKRCIDFENPIIENIELELPGKEFDNSKRPYFEKQWREIVLRNLRINYATFVKIEFEINNARFASAIWIGYPEKIFKGVAHKILQDGYVLLLEKFLWEHSLSIIATEKQNELIVHATRAAISQVMARNMSHNIGSHVMNKFVDEDDIKNIDLSQFQNYSGLNLNTNVLNRFGPYSQIAKLNNYIKCRMDYLSDITFGRPLMQTNKAIYHELFTDFDGVRLLLEHISGLSKFPYSISFLVNEIPLNENNDFPLAIPNDILGCQAFYNIIENVIRNTAKHSRNKNPNAHFTINIHEIKETEIINDAAKENGEWRKLYVVEIYDDIELIEEIDLPYNVEDGFNHFGDMVERNPHLQKLETRKIKKIDWIVYNQNEKLNQSILQGNGQLRTNSLGLLEMEASAAYLRKLDINCIESNSYEIDHNVSIHNSYGNLNILKAFNKNNSLGYRFFMMRPAEILLVSNHEFNRDKINYWLKLGVWINSIEEFTNYLSNDGVFNHSFLIYDNNTLRDVICTHSTSLPLRQLFVEDIAQSIEENFISLRDVETLAWKLWYGKLKNSYRFSCLNISNSPRYNESEGSAGKYNAVLLDHLGNEGQNWGDYVEKSNVFYLDAMSSIAQQKLPFLNADFSKYPSFLEKNPVVKYMLTESIFSRVLVIDERIQNASEEKEFVGVKFSQLYKTTGIIIPNTNLNENNYTKDHIELIKVEISNIISDFNRYHDFILFHYSILERMHDSNIAKINEYIDEIAEMTNVVITSGRGTPNGLSKKIRFVNLSPVINAFVDIRSKYLINYLLHSARKSNRI